MTSPPHARSACDISLPNRCQASSQGLERNPLGQLVGIASFRSKVSCKYWSRRAAAAFSRGLAVSRWGSGSDRSPRQLARDHLAGKLVHASRRVSGSNAFQLRSGRVWPCDRIIFVEDERTRRPRRPAPRGPWASPIPLAEVAEYLSSSAWALVRGSSSSRSASNPLITEGPR